MPGNTVTVKILGDSSGLEKTLNVTADKSDSFGKKLGAVLGGIGGAAAISKVKDFATDSIAAFKDSQVAAAQLDDAFARFPALADTSAGALRDLNSELAKKTKYDDDATSAAQATLATMGLTGSQIEKLTPLVQDYASKTGTDLPAAAEALGKAVSLGSGKALKALGVDFKDTGSEAGNFAAVQDILTQKVGGFATQEGATAAGKAEILKNQFGELQETVGSKLLPVLTRLTELGLKVVDFLGNLSPGVQTAIGVVIGLAVAAAAIVKVTQAWTAVQAALNVVMALNPVALVVIAIVALIAIIVIAYQRSETFRAIVQGAFEGIKTAAFGLWDGIKAAVGGIVAGFGWVQDKVGAVFGWVQGNWPLLLGILTGPIGLAVAAIATHWQTIKDGASEVVGWVTGKFGTAVDTLKAVFSTVAGAIYSGFDAAREAIKTPINAIIWMVNKAIDGINKLLDAPTWAKLAIPGLAIASAVGGRMDHVPALADGGIIRARSGGTIVRAGEAGYDEAVVPLDGRFGSPSGGDLYVTVNVEGSVVAERELQAAVIESIEQHAAGGGTIGNRRGGQLRFE